MPRSKKQSSTEPAKRSRPATTPEARERRNVALAMNLAEQQLRDGTASAQVITHFLKIGATVAQYELEQLKLENELLKAKTSAIKAQESTEKLYADAIKAYGRYSGNPTQEEPNED